VSSLYITERLGKDKAVGYIDRTVPAGWSKWVSLQNVPARVAAPNGCALRPFLIRKRSNTPPATTARINHGK
jgi:hypothetical protein